jgi:serine/threonine-protein kinase
MTFGTADYISPEQAQGLDATPQSDIYSLGVVLYEMLTAHLPFTADTPMAVAIQHIQKPAPPLRQWNPQIPPALDTLVMRAIAKQPQGRPASAKAFAQELRDYLAGRMQQTVAVPMPQPQRQPAPGPTVRNAAPQSYEPRRQPQRPAYVAPPPPLAAAPRDRGGLGFGTLLIGLLFLAGIVALAYVAFTPAGAGLFDFGNGGVVAQPSASAAPTATVAPTVTTTPQPTTTPVPLVTLPNFVGQGEGTVVQTQLPQLKLLRRFDPNDPNLQPRFDAAPSGTVIEQAPAAGQQIEENSPVTIIVSLGPAPNVVGRPFDVASAELARGLVTVQRQDVPSRTVPAGSVATQDPAAGGALAHGTTVTLGVSLGDVVAFPDVLNNDTPIDVARQRVTEAGFVIVAEDGQTRDRLPNFDAFLPNEVVSATANGQPIDTQGKFVPRGASVIIAFRAP